MWASRFITNSQVYYLATTDSDRRLKKKKKKKNHQHPWDNIIYITKGQIATS